jgi:hypothetical protein
MNSNVFFGDRINDWINTIHAIISRKYDMKKIKIKGYGEDAYKSILTAILSNVTTTCILHSMNNQLIIDKYVKLAHDAWVTNYIHWKHMEYNNDIYRTKRPINTPDRNDRATTHYTNLFDSDAELYVDIIQEVFTILKKKVIESGMQSLSVN